MKYLLVWTILVFIFLVSVISVKAQQEATSSGIAIPTTIDDSPVTSGNIVCSSKSGYKLCRASYDSSIYGVVNTIPSVSLGQVSSDKDSYVIVSGVVTVTVSSANGGITQGDLITTSDKPGIGQKATKNGYVLGTALESFSSNDPNQTSIILVSINIHPTTSNSDAKTNLVEVLKNGLSATILTPIEALRYMLAAFVTISAFILAFVYFGRLARAGIEGIARNPLAQGRIEFTVILHIVITIGIFLAGLGISYLILRI
ncbi:MAG: hypothetical protein HY044_00115 [Candidatus Woesebacteria bacterium]|nr:MAG: hypothetical protein HY044_00115 [Candidatus Woesebacteria bacterium]